VYTTCHHDKFQPFLPPQKIKSITRQIVSALSFCHSRRIMHRDLKPQNILLNMNGMYILKN
jgi:serine/threonine protein kinase